MDRTSVVIAIFCFSFGALLYCARRPSPQYVECARVRTKIAVTWNDGVTRETNVFACPLGGGEPRTALVDSKMPSKMEFRDDLRIEDL